MCEDLRHAALYGEEVEEDQACDSVYLADDAIMRMGNKRLHQHRSKRELTNIKMALTAHLVVT